MFCPKCGNEIKADENFCSRCGDEVSTLFNQQGNTQNIQNNEYQQQNYNPPVESQGATGLKLAIILIASLLGLVIIAFGTIFAIKMTSGSANGFQLYVSDVPALVTAENINLEITVSSRKAATLSLEDIEEKIPKMTKNKVYNETVNLVDGENNITIVLNDGTRQLVKELSIRCDKKHGMPYETGCKLIKSTQDGIYIRPQPSKGDLFVIKIDRSDFDTSLEFQGEVATDSEGYQWLKVKTPANGYGWVRGDLVIPQ